MSSIMPHGWWHAHSETNKKSNEILQAISDLKQEISKNRREEKENSEFTQKLLAQYHKQTLSNLSSLSTLFNSAIANLSSADALQFLLLLDNLDTAQKDLDLLLSVVGVGVAVHETIIFINAKGEETMDASFLTSEVITAKVTGKDAAGSNATIDQTKISYTSSDPTLVSVAQDSTTGIPTFSFNTAFAGTLPATSTITETDSANENLTATSVLTVNADKPVSEEIIFDAAKPSSAPATPAPTV